MKILVLGSSGNFGSALTDYLKKNGHQVTPMEKGQRMPAPLREFDACFLAIPLQEAVEFLERNSHTKLIEICSVKTPMKRFRNNVISIHPMFGPKSIGNPEFRNIIFVDDVSPPNSIGSIEELFPDFFIESMSADEHDRLMVELLVKPYLVSMLVSAVSKPVPWKATCTSHKAFKNLASISANESRRALIDTIRYNPYYKGAIGELQAGIANLQKEIQ